MEECFRLQTMARRYFKGAKGDRNDEQEALVTRKSLTISCIGVISLFLLSFPAWGAEVTIGPLLELPGADTMTVVWETDTAGTGSVTVRDGAGNEKEIVSPDATTRHVVTIGGLAPDTRYEYTVFADGDAVYRSWFRSLPEQGPYRVAFIGDTRGNDGVTSVIFSQVDVYNPRFIVMLGDFVDKSNRTSDWKEQIFDPGKKLFDHIPIFAITGNHDVQYDPTGEMFRRFFLRPPSTPAGTLIYNVTICGDLYIFADYYTNRPILAVTDGIKLYRLLHDASERADTGHIFLLVHDGVISHWIFRSGNFALKPLLRIMGKYGVTAMISGHDHYYARGITYSGVPFFITGGGGSTLRQRNKYNFYAVLTGRTDFLKSTHHFLVMDVDRQACTFRAVLPDGVVFDTAVIKRGK
jgi:hypothetical protein